ncbi:Uncharacterized protein M6B38_228745 [Iris pallida]|uniref:SAM domain-containing protein n=1 Tax=Iris pallida TaxID=29817 RepID=A0AAX6DT63_IRIPA|nr:Uncharacterized protein M6B38_228745 [Iris pallida]
MDWYSWLSRSGLDPPLVYDYSLLLASNELDEEDIAHFDHEFLKSMGISVAKHRLEILKLAKKHRAGRRTIAPPRPVARLFSTIVRTKKSLSRYFHALFDIGCESSAIVAVPKPAAAYATTGGATRWRGAMLKRRKKGQLARLMITEGEGRGRVARPKPNSVSHSASPMVYRGGQDNKGEEEIRWDSMFQNLNPT